MYCHARVTAVPALMFKHLDALYNICGRDKQCIVRKLAGNLSPERPRCKWKDNIKMDLKNMVCVDWIQQMKGMVQLWTLGNTGMNLQVPH
jgi:hypothetical protein